MADDDTQLSLGGATTDEEKVVRFDNPLWQGGFTAVPNYVLLNSDLSATARMVYIGLLYFAREDDECFPGQEKFAKCIGIPERTMREGLRDLEKAGLLAVKRRRSRSNLYTLLTPGIGEIRRSVPAKSADPDRRNSPDSKKKQKEEDTEKKKQEAAQLDSEVEQVWNHYIEIFEPSSRVKCGPSRVRGIKAALAEVDLATLLQAIDGLKAFRAHKPGDTSIEAIWKTFKGTGSRVERINFFASQAKGSVPGQRQFPSAQPAIVAQRQLDVQRGHGSQNPDIVERANESEAWLRRHGIETVRRESDGYPVFRAMNTGAAAS